MTIWICSACGVEHPDTENPPALCAICSDERQYVPVTGQDWTTLAELAAEDFEIEHDELEPGLLHRFHRVPRFGIGQHTHLVVTEAGNLIFDPPNHLDEGLAETIESLGGAACIVASHPHMYGSQVSWSHRLGSIPVLVNAADRQWVQREDPVIQEWRTSEEILPGVTLVEVGGHFPGMTVTHLAAGSAGRGTLLTGDAMMTVADAGWLTFLRSYPNRIPLSAGLVRRLVDRLAPYDFDSLHTLAGGDIPKNAKHAVHRSADRYIAWVSGANDHLG
jgi:hypothetical protein